jgi:hypothetical protein
MKINQLSRSRLCSVLSHLYLVFGELLAAALRDRLKDGCFPIALQSIDLIWAIASLR